MQLKTGFFNFLRYTLRARITNLREGSVEIEIEQSSSLIHNTIFIRRTANMLFKKTSKMLWIFKA